jgi:hypothetical protein
MDDAAGDGPQEDGPQSQEAGADGIVMAAIKLFKHELDRVESPAGWFSPRRKDYEMECCKCGLRHLIDFRINRKYKNRDIIQIRVKPYGSGKP